MDECAILHSDMNYFYASVEMMLDPSLKGKAVAVCGSVEERHGIVLAKSDLAKKAGVKTGMVSWQAKQLCPELILVPPQYDEYLKYSKLAHGIYERYTPLREPFGIESVTASIRAAATKVLGSGTRYTVVIKGQEKYLFEEAGRWFVKAVIPA